MFPAPGMPRCGRFAPQACRSSDVPPVVGLGAGDRPGQRLAAAQAARLVFGGRGSIWSGVGAVLISPPRGSSELNRGGRTLRAPVAAVQTRRRRAGA